MPVIMQKKLLAGLPVDEVSGAVSSRQAKTWPTRKARPRKEAAIRAPCGRLRHGGVHRYLRRALQRGAAHGRQHRRIQQ